MGSMKSPPATSTVDQPVLEAKVDHLARTLEQIFSRRNDCCPICSTCSLHSNQQGATERQLASQSRLLEKLEKEVAKMQRTLEGLSKGLDGRGPYTLQSAAPTMETPASITSGLSRTQLLTGKVGQWIGGNPQEIRGPSMARSHRPSEVVVAVVVPSTSAIQKTTTITTAGTENKPATDETSNQVETNRHHVTKQHTLTTPPKKDAITPQAAPFLHRVISLRSNTPSDAFIIHVKEVLGGGRFGTVHRCTEKSSGLRLAAKIIKTRNAKEKEMAVTEVQVMNQLSHANILQLYDAFETNNQVVLILEYVEGGELFDRIVDESAPLTEVDAMLFLRQVCEGVHYLHQMYILHLDLKPENILCVNRNGHQVKIIDFGLARRYRPRDKQRVNFGTPEFLAPEVVNYDFVSFPTDMWTLGVVTYMLLSGLSPFLGDDDSQTLNNVLAVNWYFEEEAFEHISAEARDFISNLLIREKGGRLSAAQCLNHPWLNNISEKAKHSAIVLKSQVLLKKYMAKRLWKKNYIAIAAANRFKKISSTGCLTSLDV